MMKSTFLLRMEPELKERLQRMANAERRSMTSLILFLIDKKIKECKNATG